MTSSGNLVKYESRCENLHDKLSNLATLQSERLKPKSQKPADYLYYKFCKVCTEKLARSIEMYKQRPHSLRCICRTFSVSFLIHLTVTHSTPCTVVSSDLINRNIINLLTPSVPILRATFPQVYNPLTIRHK